MSNKTLISSWFRLQGTDGIRSQARRKTKKDGDDPLGIFLERKILTDQFMELYVHTWIRGLQKINPNNSKTAIVVGWDPRDTEGVFSQAVIRGVRKAGVKALVAGVVPTPLVPMMVIEKKAAGGVMITGSHNPKDQNGIKLFSGYRGLKLLPANDRALTRAVFKIRFSSIARLPLKGSRVDIRQEALSVFTRFHLQQENSWQEGNSFKNITLVVDAANGSLSRIAKEILQRAGFGEVIEVNGRLNGHVNQYSGVADLEGHAVILPEAILKGSGAFNRYRAIFKLFELGRQYKIEIERGRRRVCGAVFDADGDRFFMLEYDPFRDRVIVLSGDETAAHQMKYLKYLRPNTKVFYLNTVESDLNAARAIGDLGVETRLTPVGDKWILSHILLTELESRVRGRGKDQKWLGGIKKEIHRLKKTGVSDVQELEALESMVMAQEKLFGKPFDSLPLFVGSEETGHSITVGWLGEGPRVFTGNGLKNALNTFAATQHLYQRKIVRSFLQALAQPFRPGFKQVYYVFYVKKDLFCKGSAIWKSVNRCIRIKAKFFGWSCKIVTFSQDQDMLYLALFPPSDRAAEPSAAIFIRNSGTENKIGVNLRGRKKDARKLQTLGEAIVRILIKTMKDSADPWMQSERHLLNQLAVKRVPEFKIEVTPERRQQLLNEMKKQRLIEFTPSGYRLTRLGKWVTIH